MCYTDRRGTVQQNKSGQADLFDIKEILNIVHVDLFLFKSFTRRNVQRRMKHNITVFRCGCPEASYPVKYFEEGAS